nr:translocation/assembly module TamB domain-containing protein [Wenzhouxiangella sp. XN24]
MAGTVNGQLDLAGDGREFRRLGGRLEITPGSITQAGADDTRDTLLAWRDGILQLDGDPAAAQATLDLDLKSDDRLDGRLAIAWNEPDPALDGELNIAFSQLDIITEFVPDLSGLEGQAEASAALTGSIAAPQLTGRFAWRDGSVQIPTLGIRPDDIEVVARLAKSELVFDASGRSGEGEFRAEGRFELGADTIEGVATLEGERLLVMDLPEMRVAASPDLRFRYLPDRINIGGELTIPFARITGFGGSGAVTTSPDEVIISEDGEEKGQELVIASRIRVDVGPDVRLDVAGLRGAVEGEIIAATEPESLPWGRGELRVVDGNFRAFGQQLEIETGRLIYTGGPLENPGLDIRAIREVRDVTAGALIRGTLERPELSIFSDPPMPRAEALSYLTLGKGMDELQAGEQRTLNQAASSLALSGGGLIARDLGRRLGLDEVSVSAANGAEGAALVLGKHLGGGLYVSYGLGLFDAVNTLRLRYQITRRLSIEAVSGDQAEADLFYTFERD